MSMKQKLYQTNQFLSHPLVIILIILTAIAFFTVRSYQDQKDLRETVENTRTIIADLKEAVTELKQDNAKTSEEQTKLIVCLLVAHGEDSFITPEAQAECGRATQQISSETLDSVNPRPSSKPKPKPKPEPKEELPPPPRNPIESLLCEITFGRVCPDETAN